jgi:hypothetical protein
MAVAATVAFAGAAQAQVCVGFPTLAGQFSLDAFAGFPEDADVFGVNGSYNLAGPVAVNGTVQVWSPDGDGDNEVAFGAGLAFKLMQPMPGMTGISVCPAVNLLFMSLGEFEGESVDYLEIPIGVGIGTSFAMGDGNMALQPFVVPAIYLQRFSFAGESETETDFGFRGGANLSLDRFFVGATIEHIFISDGPNPTFGVRVGFRM